MGVLICETILGILVFFTGTCIFSFLNVIIYRVPRQMSFVKGFSICPSCGKRLGPKDLVPALAILFGGIYGCYLLAAKKADRKAHFAFGPFLCIGMAIGLLYGIRLIDWYLSLMIY